MNVLESTQWVVHNSELVSIDQEKVAALAGKWAQDGIKAPDWDRTYHYSGPEELTVNYLLLLESLNFSFWGEPVWEIEFNGQTLSGYWAYAAALTRAVQEGVPVLDTKYLASISYDQAWNIFRGQNDIPLRSERCGVIRNIARAVEGKYGGQFINVIRAAGGSALRLMELVTTELPMFSDSATYRGHEVFFYKRAQMMVADLWGLFDGKGLGDFSDMDQLTAFADYKVPQVLRELGVLRYAEPLGNKVDSLQAIQSGSQEEVEIRACTIWAVESLRGALKEHGVDIPAFQLDWYLWDQGQRLDFSKPHHRSRSIHY